MKRTDVSSHVPIPALRARCAQMTDPVNLSTGSNENEQHEESPSRKRAHHAEGVSTTSTISTSSNHHSVRDLVEEERERDFQNINTRFEDLENGTDILIHKARKLRDSLAYILAEMMETDEGILELTQQIVTQHHVFIEHVKTSSLTRAEKYEELKRMKVLAAESLKGDIQSMCNVSQKLIKCTRLKFTTEDVQQVIAVGYSEIEKQAEFCLNGLSRDSNA